MSLFPLVNFVLSVLALILAGLAETYTHKATEKFTVGELKELGKSISFTIYGIIGKLFFDILAFLLLQTEFSNIAIIDTLSAFSLVFLVFAVIMIIKIAFSIKKLADRFGFVD
ncbi:MAG: hypothetical protein ABIH20_05840 [Candidatus Diapherotrites archaeon]